MIQPLNDIVVVKLLEEQESQRSLIIVPGAQKLQYAEVVAVGNGYLSENGTRVALAVEAGQKVLLDPGMKYSPIEVEGEKVVFIKERQILAVIK